MRSLPSRSLPSFYCPATAGVALRGENVFFFTKIWGGGNSKRGPPQQKLLLGSFFLSGPPLSWLPPYFSLAIMEGQTLFKGYEERRGRGRIGRTLSLFELGLEFPNKYKKLHEKEHRLLFGFVYKTALCLEGSFGCSGVPTNHEGKNEFVYFCLPRGAFLS